MTIECPHDRVEFEKAGIVLCNQCGKRTLMADGLCRKCQLPLDDPPHVRGEACK